MRYSFLGFFLGLFCLVLLGSSCTSYKKIPYFVGLHDTTFKVANQPGPLVINKGDQLSIFISCSDPLDAFIFNQPNSGQVSVQSVNNSTAGSVTSGYLVNEQGYLLFPKLGMIKVIGMTKVQLQDTLQRRLLAFVKDPQVSIRLLNYRISVLGEVARPGLYTIPYEQITLMQVLGMAGDLTLYGRRNNILLIRQTDSVVTVHYLNLQDKTLLQSQYYNLQSGDVLYVTPNKVRENSTKESLQLLPIGLSILSTLIILVSYLGITLKP